MCASRFTKRADLMVVVEEFAVYILRTHKLYLIDAYARQGDGYARQALSLFFQMQGMGVKPDRYTFINIVTTCASSDCCGAGKEV
jgi:pentatricopeptide repeat protein